MQDKKVMEQIAGLCDALTKVMSKQQSTSVLMSVPSAVLEDAGIRDGDTLQFYADAGRVIIERVEPRGEVVCDGDCDDCPCADHCEESEVEK